MIAVVHRGFASVPPLFLSPSSLSSFFLPFLPFSLAALPFLPSISSRPFLALPRPPLLSVHHHLAHTVLFLRSRSRHVRFHEVQRYTPLHSRRSNLRTAGATRTNARCARREGIRRIFVFAHSRANAHPSSRDPPRNHLDGVPSVLSRTNLRRRDGPEFNRRRKPLTTVSCL